MWNEHRSTGADSYRHLAGRLRRVVQNRHLMRVSVGVVIVCVV